MISVFYSTRKSNPSHYKSLKKSCSFKNIEIIEFVNEGTHSLAEAYNKAIDESKYDILICLHDDVYLEKGWDKKIYSYFNESDYGILGVAGTTDLPANGKWWEDQHRMVGCVYHKNGSKWIKTQYSQIFSNKIIEVACIDGLFIALHKQRIKERFDERFEGFHFYDIPFCVSNHLKDVSVGVVTDLKIKHDSIGVPNEQWFENKQKFSELYKEELPLKIKPPIIYEDNPVKLKKEPKLGIIIPTKDNFDYLERCVMSLLKTNYKNFNIYIADTGSSEDNFEKIKGLYKKVNAEGKEIIRLIRYDYYHFSKINNQVVENHMDKDTEIILFCNDDIEMLNDAISLMVKQYNKHKNHVGTIGCRLHYVDNSIQHGGIQLILTKDGKMGVSHHGIKSYYNASFSKEYDVLGNTAAFMMISRELFFKLNGFDNRTEECFEDVLLNIDSILNGYKNIYIGQAACYHYESVTRSKDSNKQAREKSDLMTYLVPKIQENILRLKKYATLIK